MSLSEQTSRVANGGKNTLKAILEKMGATVPDTTKIDGYPALAAGVDNMAISAATKALYGLGSDAVPDDVLNKLSKSILYYSTSTPKYQEVTVDLSTVQEGDIVQLPENGVLVDFYVAKLNYESTLNGTGRTLLVRKDCYDNRQWDSGNVNAYASSDLDSWFNSTYKNMLDADIRSLIGTTKIHYTPGNGNNTVGTLERSVFALSLTELGESHTYANVEGSALPIASTLKIAYLNGSANTQWTRSPYTNNASNAWWLGSNGDFDLNICGVTHGSRPAFTLPSTFSATYYVDSSGNLHDEQEYAGSTTDVKGNPITIGTQIATVSYVGTGTYGASNPNTITFPFIPKIWGVFCRERLVGNSYNYYFFNDAGNIWIWGKNSTQFGAASSNSDWTITFNGGTVSWYTNDTGSTAAGYQFNDSNYTYYVFAIG